MGSGRLWEEGGGGRFQSVIAVTIVTSSHSDDSYKCENSIDKGQQGPRQLLAHQIQRVANESKKPLLWNLTLRWHFWDQALLQHYRTLL